MDWRVFVPLIPYLVCPVLWFFWTRVMVALPWVMTFWLSKPRRRRRSDGLPFDVYDQGG